MKGNVVSDNFRLTPEDDFPVELEDLKDGKLQILDSQIQRQLDHEVVTEGESNPETDFRHHELDLEFENREG